MIIYSPPPLPSPSFTEPGQAKLIEKNKDTKRDKKIADFIVLFTLQRLVSECCPFLKKKLIYNAVKKDGPLYYKHISFVINDVNLKQEKCLLNFVEYCDLASFKKVHPKNKKI